ncbi:unnamed protein product [Pylaiella littoralis]
MLFTSAKVISREAMVYGLSSTGPTLSSSDDAYRSFCDLFEEDGSEDDVPLSSGKSDAVVEPGTATAERAPNVAATAPAVLAVEGASAASSASSYIARGKTIEGRRTLTTAATSSSSSSTYFSGAAASIRRGLIGRNAPFRTPYGMKPLVYSDWTATGRAVDSIETYLADQVVPLFGNTHTTTSITGAQTTCFRHEARQIIAQAVNAKVTGRAAEDVVLFTGTGATAAVAKLVSALGLDRSLPPGCEPSDRPVIFVGPFEHHSNLLPWRESCGEVVTIGEDLSPGGGRLDLKALEGQLRRYANRKLKIGSFTAASNVTGGLEDVDRVTATLHRAGALALWDYATAAPYVHVNMNPAASGVEDDQALVAKDAIFFSGHKFVGGPGTPGVLVVKKRLLCNSVPGTVGGGTVFFVTQNDHRYLSNKEEREEGGTPDILGAVRLGLAVQMKERLGRQGLLEREEALAELGLKMLRAHPRIVLLGDTGRKRLPIFSFLVRTITDGRFLHYNFVCALLNDLFGVQSRGGCQCAGPYSQSLLGMSLADTRAVEAELLHKNELLRPGFSRLSLSYVNSDREAKYILYAIKFVADHGAVFLPYYRLNYKTGEWKHKTRFTRFPERRWLGNCDYGFPPKVSEHNNTANGGVSQTVSSSPSSPPKTADNATTIAASESMAVDNEAVPKADEAEERGGEENSLERAEVELLEDVFEDAKRHLEAAEAGVGEKRWQGSEDVLGAEGESLRWFLYPWEGGRTGGGTLNLNNNPSSSDVVANGIASGSGSDSCACIINPRVYGDVAAVADREAMAAADATIPAERVAMRLDGVGGDATVAAAASGGGGVEAPVAGTAAAAVVASEEGKVEAELESGMPQPPPPPPPPRPDGFGEQDGESSAAPRISGSREAAAVDGGSTSNDGAGIGSGSSGAANSADGGGGSKLKGYEGHMSALGKLGAGSAESRLFPKPGKKLLKAVGQAVQGWKMIEDGDRLCLGLSGGKDSMTLLHVLLDLKKRAPINFEVACATVDPQTASFDPSPLIPYLERLGVKLHYLSAPIIEQAKTSMQGDSLCAFCARMKRGLLYSCCREHGYNKLVLAQHLDDLAESFIMSALHNGQVRTMKANYKIEAGDVRVIRPLCYAREALMKDFARTNRLPVVNENCPACFEEPKERHRVKKMLAKEESLFPAMYANLRRALVPLMDDEAYVSMDKTSSEVAARQVERHSRPPTRKLKPSPERQNPRVSAESSSPATTTIANRQGHAIIGATKPPNPGESAATAATVAVVDTGDFAGDEQNAPMMVAPADGPPGKLTATCSMDDENEGPNTSRLAEFSEEALKRELARRRAGVGVGVTVACSDGGGKGVPCRQDGGVCVPCFEIM